MPTVVQSGSQTTTVTTEHTVTTTITAAGTYVAKFDLAAMAAGDIVEIRVKCKCRAADTQRVAYVASFANAQSMPIVQSVPIVIATSEDLDVSIKQTDGSSRAIPWNVLSL